MTEEEKKLTREEVAKREIGHTDISPKLARGITMAFLAIVLAVPALQHIEDFKAYKVRQKMGETEARSFGWLPRSYDIFRLPEKSEEIKKKSLLARLFTSNARILEHIELYEEKLESDSLLSVKLDWVQYFMLKHLGQGNEKAYPGRDGWLYFRPSMDYVTGPGFLEDWKLKKRRLAGNEYTDPPQPDPRKAIIEFHHQLAEKGIKLILIPVPAKPTINPEQFIQIHTPRHKVANNPSYDQLLKELREAGVDVFDITSILEEGYQFSGMPQYLETDTHWKPGPMEFVARRLTEYLVKEGLLEEGSGLYARRPLKVSNVGDIATMLKLPDDQDMYKAQEVSIRQVYDKRSGNLWDPSRISELLVLGDSFSNIFSMPEMGWGSSAGFVEQISFYLQRPVDSIVQNDAGAHATREELTRQLRRDPDRLAGKKAVIWEFAARELAVGDWR